jgi:hypothetical protein
MPLNLPNFLGAPLPVTDWTGLRDIVKNYQQGRAGTLANQSTELDIAEKQRKQQMLANAMLAEQQAWNGGQSGGAPGNQRQMPNMDVLSQAIQNNQTGFPDAMGQMGNEGMSNPYSNPYGNPNEMQGNPYEDLSQMLQQRQQMQQMQQPQGQIPPQQQELAQSMGAGQPITDEQFWSGYNSAALMGQKINDRLIPDSGQREISYYNPRAGRMVTKIIQEGRTPEDIAGKVTEAQEQSKHHAAKREQVSENYMGARELRNTLEGVYDLINEDLDLFRASTGPIATRTGKLGYGTPESKQLIGKLEAFSGDILSKSLKAMFTGRTMANEIDVINRVKYTPTDDPDIAIGKIEAQMKMTIQTERAAELMNNLMEEGLSYEKASDIAAKSLDFNKVDKEYKEFLGKNKSSNRGSQGGIVSGILKGKKYDLPPDEIERFKRAGGVING